MEAAYREYEDQGMLIIAISIGEDVDTVADFSGQEGFTFPIGLDSDGQVATRYLVFKHPETFFIDSEGIVRQRTIGPLDKEVIIEKFERTKEKNS